MRIELSVIDQWYRWGLIATTLILAVIDLILPTPNVWINGFFIVCMAGIVGYFTNFLAIKMLFQPKKGKVLGWEGLVPKNQAKIAISLGESIQTQLLAPDIILDYIYERNLIEIGIKKIVTWVDGLLKNQKFRNTVTTKLVSLLKEKGPEILSSTFNFSEEALKKIAKNPDEIKKYWELARNKILEYIQNQENREKIATLIIKVIKEEIPRLSKVLNEALEEYLREKKTIGGLGIGIKKLIAFDDDAIQELLEKFTEDPETSDQLLGVLDILVEEFRANLSSSETQEFIASKVEEWVSKAGNYARQNILPTTINKLEEYLDNENNWKQVEEYFFQSVEWIKIKVLDFINSTEGRGFLKAGIEKAIRQLNVTQLVEEQVMKLDTDELEKMILDNTGGNLVVIQFLGGILGMIAGLIQVNIAFSLPVFSLILITWVSHYRNKAKYVKKGEW